MNEPVSESKAKDIDSVDEIYFQTRKENQKPKKVCYEQE
jgi:hypothetical protein